VTFVTRSVSAAVIFRRRQGMSAAFNVFAPRAIVSAARGNTRQFYCIYHGAYNPTVDEVPARGLSRTRQEEQGPVRARLSYKVFYFANLDPTRRP